MPRPKYQDMKIALERISLMQHISSRGAWVMRSLARKALGMAPVIDEDFEILEILKPGQPEPADHPDGQTLYEFMKSEMEKADVKEEDFR